MFSSCWGFKKGDISFRCFNFRIPQLWVRLCDTLSCYLLVLSSFLYWPNLIWTSVFYPLLPGNKHWEVWTVVSRIHFSLTVFLQLGMGLQLWRVLLARPLTQGACEAIQMCCTPCSENLCLCAGKSCVESPQVTLEVSPDPCGHRRCSGASSRTLLVTTFCPTLISPGSTPLGLAPYHKVQTTNLK